MEIFEDSRVVSRADLAAWLRQMAGQLESDGKVLFGAAGSVTVADEVHCELEIESSGSETSIEIEFTWTDAASGTADDADEDEAEDGEQDSAEQVEAEQGEEEPATTPTAVGVAEASPASAVSSAGDDVARPVASSG